MCVGAVDRGGRLFHSVWGQWESNPKPREARGEVNRNRGANHTVSFRPCAGAWARADPFWRELNDVDVASAPSW